MSVIFILTFVWLCLSKIRCRRSLVPINQWDRQREAWSLLLWEEKANDLHAWWGRDQTGKDHQSREEWSRVCTCESVGLLAMSWLKWPLIVFLHYLIVKKISAADYFTVDLEPFTELIHYQPPPFCKHRLFERLIVRLIVAWSQNADMNKYSF